MIGASCLNALVCEAMRFDKRAKAELTTILSITELDNPNSVAQMKLWLAENGLETDITWVRLPLRNC